MNECCDYWEIGIDELVRCIDGEQERNPHTKYTPFNYCPWCGMKREKVVYDKTESLIRDLNSKY